VRMQSNLAGRKVEIIGEFDAGPFKTEPGKTISLSL